MIWEKQNKTGITTHIKAKKREELLPWEKAQEQLGLGTGSARQQRAATDIAGKLGQQVKQAAPKPLDQWIPEPEYGPNYFRNAEGEVLHREEILAKKAAPTAPTGWDQRATRGKVGAPSMAMMTKDLTCSSNTSR